MGTHKVALIGASGWGSNYLKKLSLSSDFEVVDINKNVLSTIEKKYKYKVSTDTEDIDTVFIITPNHLHYNFAKQLLEREKNVYIEKPLANTSTEAKDCY